MIEDNGVGIPESVMKQINAMLRGEDIFSSGEQIEHRGAIQNVNARLQMCTLDTSMAFFPVSTGRASAPTT